MFKYISYIKYAPILYPLIRYANCDDKTNSSKIHIHRFLLIGETGSGKSTLVNMLVNSYLGGSLSDIKIVIPTKFFPKPTEKKLLPLPVSEDDNKSLGHRWDYIYEPDSKELLDFLLERYIELQIYQATIENIACEQAAKMIAMKSATDNAGELIKQFQLAYNKARQAAITQELSEIVGGASAL